jgi:arylsulfatase A
MITRLDRGVGRLLAKIEDLGIDGNTLVFFTSDNGPHREGGANPEFFHSSGSLRGIKRDLYEGGIRVPLLVRWPRQIVAGTVTNHVCAFWDFLPTLAELAGVQPPADIDGISLRPTLLGQLQQQDRHEFLYWEFHEGGFQQAVRMGRWKAVRRRVGGKLELYDLQDDLGETTNVAGSQPEVVAKIEEYLATARNGSQFWPVKGGKA